MKKGATEQSIRLRYLSLKGLAGLLATVKGREGAALGFYRLASIEDDSDVIMWDRYGTLALEQGEWAIARAALCRVLHLNPMHPTAADKLLDVLLHVGDFVAAKAFANTYSKLFSWNRTCRLIKHDESFCWLKDEKQWKHMEHLPPTSFPEPLESVLESGSSLVVLQLRRLTWRELINRLCSLIVEDNYFHGKVRFRAPSRAVDDKGGPASAGPADLENINMESSFDPNSSRMETDGNRFENPSEVEEMDEEDDIENNAEQSQSQDQPELNVNKSAGICDHFLSAPESVRNKASEQDTEEIVVLSPKKLSSKKENPREAVEQNSCPSMLPPQPNSQDLPLVSKNLGLCGKYTKQAFKYEDKLVEDRADSQDQNIDLLIKQLVSKKCQRGKQVMKEIFKIISDEKQSQRDCAAADGNYVDYPSEYEAEDVTRTVLGRPGGMVTMHLAVGLIERWTKDRDSAARLRSCGGVEPLLQLALTLYHRNWQGYEISTESCMILAELFIDVGVQAVQTKDGKSNVAGTLLTTGSRSRGIAQKIVHFMREDYIVGSQVWLSRFFPTFYNQHEADNLLRETALGLEEKFQLSDDFRFVHMESQMRRVLEILNTSSSDVEQNGNVKYISMPHQISSEDLELIRLKDYVDKEVGYIRLLRCAWARIRIQEACGAFKEAIETCNVCLRSLEHTNASISLEHCAKDSLITYKTIKDKIEILKLQNAIEKATMCEQNEEFENAIEILVPSILGGSTIEALLLRKDKSNWMKALSILNYAAQATSNPLLSFRCHVRFLHTALPLVEEDNAGLTTGELLDAAQTLFQASDFFSSLSYVSKWKELSIEEFEKNLLGSLLLRCFHVFVSCCQILSDEIRQENVQILEVKKILQSVASDAATIALQLWRLVENLDCIKEKSPIQYLLHNFEFAYWVTEKLGNCNCLFEYRGNFPFVLLNHSIDMNSICRSIDKEVLTSSQESILSCGEISFTAAVKHSLYWLYGLRLSDMEDEIWGGSQYHSIPESLFDKRIQTLDKDTVLRIWPYISPFLGNQSVAQLRTYPLQMFVSCIASLFSSPPDSLAAKINDIWDSMSTEKAPELKILREGATKISASEILEKFAQVGRDSRNSCGIATEISIHTLIHHLKAISQESLEEILRSTNSDAFDVDTHAKISEWMMPLHWDLSFNSFRVLDGWLLLAKAYFAVANFMSYEAGMDLLASEWRYDSFKREKIKLNEQMMMWCLSIAECIARDRNTLSKMYQMHAESIRGKLLNIPPKYDQIDIYPNYDEISNGIKIEAAILLFSECAKLSPTHYLYPMYIGELRFWRGGVDKKCIEEVAKSCYLAKKFGGHLLRPLALLHALRMLVLSRFKQENQTEALFLASSICFKKDLQAKVKSVLDPNQNVEDSYLAQEIFGLTKYDLKCFFEWNIKEYQFFYPGTLALAIKELYDGENEKALDLLDNLFLENPERERDSLSVTLRTLCSQSDLHETGDQIQPVQESCSSSMREIDLVYDTTLESFSEYCVSPDEKLEAIKWPYDSAIFLGQLREALQVYVELNAASKRWNVIQEVLIALHNHEWNCHGFSDIRIYVQGYYLISLLQAAMDLCPFEKLLEIEKTVIETSPEDQLDTVQIFTPRSVFLCHIEKLASSIAAKEDGVPEVLKRLYDIWINRILHNQGANESGYINWSVNIDTAIRRILRLTTNILPLVHRENLEFLAVNPNACLVVIQTLSWLHVLVTVKSHSETPRAALEKLKPLVLHLKGTAGSLRKSFTVMGFEGCTPAVRRLIELHSHSFVHLLKLESDKLISSAVAFIDRERSGHLEMEKIGNQIDRGCIQSNSRVASNGNGKFGLGAHNEIPQLSTIEKNGNDSVSEEKNTSSYIEKVVDQIIFVDQNIHFLPWLEPSEAITKNLKHDMEDGEDILVRLFEVHEKLLGSPAQSHELSRKEKLLLCKDLILKHDKTSLPEENYEESQEIGQTLSDLSFDEQTSQSKGSTKSAPPPAKRAKVSGAI